MSRPPFRFAVIADTHVNPTDDESSSPWQVNRWANARTREVVHRVAAEEPDFVVHLGDMVHPVPGTPTYGVAAQRFFGLAEGLAAPLHLVAGNHDAGDKPVEWAPVSPIDEVSLEHYERTFGPSHYAFDHGGCHLVVINTMLVNSGMAAEEAQRAWLEQDLAEHAHERIFVFGHYPLYLARHDEPECYDNVAEPGRSWLLGLFAEHGVEAYFAGHVHNFFYNRLDGTDHYVLPSTSFVRHDYSELARVGPGPEYGRDDADKLGYVVVEIGDGGHAAHVVRSQDESTHAAGRAPVPRDGGAVPVGVDMRQAWAETVPLPYNGMLDEFVRRNVRNDYPLLALWELGVRELRIPLNDLTDPRSVERLRELSAAGHRFHVFSHDVPVGADRAALAACADVLGSVEVVVAPDRFAERKADVADLRAAVGLPVTVSPLRTSAHAARSDGAATRFTHRVGHGFATQDDVTTLDADAVAFRVPASEEPWRAVRDAGAAAARHGVRAVVHVTLAGDDPAADDGSDAATAARVAETMLAAWSTPGTLVFLDTLTDVDRGYFPRRGLVDRRFNPRPAGAVHRHLNAVLAALTPPGAPPAGVAAAHDLPGGRVCRPGDDGPLLVLPETEVAGRDVVERFAVAADAAVVDLATGARTTGADLSGATCTTPTLVVGGGAENLP